MKNTLILCGSNLIEAFSSETSWIPLSVGDYVYDCDGKCYKVHLKRYYVEDNRLEIYVS